jgi:hypothetical protein
MLQNLLRLIYFVWAWCPFSSILLYGGVVVFCRLLSSPAQAFASLSAVFTDPFGAAVLVFLAGIHPLGLSIKPRGCASSVRPWLTSLDEISDNGHSALLCVSDLNVICPILKLRIRHEFVVFK